MSCVNRITRSTIRSLPRTQSVKWRFHWVLLLCIGFDFGQRIIKTLINREETPCDTNSEFSVQFQLTQFSIEPRCSICSTKRWPKYHHLIIKESSLRTTILSRERDVEIKPEGNIIWTTFCDFPIRVFNNSVQTSRAPLMMICVWRVWYTAVVSTRWPVNRSKWLRLLWLIQF